MENFECWMPSWEYLHLACKKIAKKMKEDKFKPDIVVALSRGGFVPARTICDMLIIKDLVSIKVDHWGLTATKDGKASIRYPLNADLMGKKILVVDDITDTGDSMLVSTDFIKTLNPTEIRTATALHIKTSKFKPDYYGEEIDWKWVVFPWNYVEDMCNIIPKVLDSKPKSEKQMKDELKNRFSLDLSEESIVEILGELEERNVATRDGKGWIKS
ncbi:MAG: phosphoribosyltransferase [Candidatus Aenigmatarchaeota archaeon]